MKTKAFTLVETMIVIVIIGLLATMAMPTYNKIRRANDPKYQRKLQIERDAVNRPIYEAWCKVHNKDISYDEWLKLYQKDLLPK